MLDVLTDFFCFFVLIKTGSGKTYTMGTNYNGQENSVGVIPKVMEMIFNRVESMKSSTEFLIRVSFIEVMNCARLFSIASVFTCSKFCRMSS